MVEWLKPSAGPTLRDLVRQVCTVALTLPASTLPSSTPHWSKELIPQMKPCSRDRSFQNNLYACRNLELLSSAANVALSLSVLCLLIKARDKPRQGNAPRGVCLRPWLVPSEKILSSLRNLQPSHAQKTPTGMSNLIAWRSTGDSQYTSTDLHSNSQLIECQKLPNCVGSAVWQHQ